MSCNIFVSLLPCWKNLVSFLKEELHRRYLLKMPGDESQKFDLSLYPLFTFEK